MGAKADRKPETRPIDPEDPDILSETSASASDGSSADENTHTSLTKTERKKRRTMQIERQVRAVALLDGFEADGSSTPQTPHQPRAKRRREWKWTLGPVNGALNISPEVSEPEIPETGPALESREANSEPAQ